MTDSQVPTASPSSKRENADTKPTSNLGGWKNLGTSLKAYCIFCIVVLATMTYANYVGWFPTYGIFSGENSMRSNGYFGRGHSGYYGGHGIHGK